MISISNLAVSFGDRTILNGISLAIHEGESFVLLGKNGTGKSVLLKAVCGLIESFSGTIEIKGVEVRRFFRNRELGGAMEGGEVKVAYVFQKGGLFDSMNVFENVAFGLKRMGADGDSLRESVLQSLSRVGLTGNEEKLPSELSGGMQKRVGLARAICMNPDIILYDDPTAGLDPILSDSIADLMLEIRDSIRATSMIVTHDLKVAEKVADSVALLYDGRIVFHGDKQGFFAETDSYARQFIQGDIDGPIDMY